MKSLRMMSVLLLSAVYTIGSLAQPIDSSLLQSLHWRMIGPFRGGRTVGASGVVGQPNIFYIGVNNGGVWKTNDDGRTWKPIFDDQPTGSIGALAVAPSNPNIIYVGSGEGLQRPDLSVGDGMFKSTDGGTTWKHLGLSDAQQIGSVLIDPNDPNRVFVAVLGHPYGPNEERGVFRTTDGGATWQNILYKDENTGAIGLAFDPKSTQVIYADLWSARQGPWENGEWEGKTSGLFKSTDGGTTWHQLTIGLPTANDGLGRIGFSVAPSDSARLYATVSAEKNGGIYRSDDAGERWTRVSSDDRLWGRGDDFAEIKVHPKNKDVVYVANTASYESTDGGTSWTCFRGAPGGDDYHAIWINPDEPDIMLLAADQGAVITVNGGESWSSWYNQPTAQFYHVSTDNEFPYNVYGGQQESGSACVSSRGNDGQITFREWHPVGADEYAYVAPDPLHPNLVYGGRVTRYDKTTGQVQDVAPEAIRSGKYRMLRTMPLIFSPVDQHALYCATNVLWKTTNGGDAWEIVSPDLSREHPDVPENVGIFRTDQLKSMPRRGVIYAVAPSYKDAKVIWAGTDDGFVHVTWDGGKHWENVTPPAVTSWSKVAQIDAGRFDVRTAYVAVNRFRLDDLKPLIYRTHDGGKTWVEIVSGLPGNGPVNTVREDPVRKGLLYAGTEREVYVSFDDGNHWQSLRLNMPATSVRDLVVHDDDLVVGTHGRSFWILDNVTPLRQIDGHVLGSAAHLFKPQVAIRVRWNQNTDTPLPPDEPAGQNPPDGALIDYYLQSDARTVTLEIYNAVGTLVRKYSSTDKPDEVNEHALPYPKFWIRPPQTLSTRAGMHRFAWDLRLAPPSGVDRWYPIAAIFKNTSSLPLGPWVQPGTYSLRLTVDGHSIAQPLTVKMDPRVKTSPADVKKQFDQSFVCYRDLMQLNDTMTEVRNWRKRVEQKEATTSGTALDSLRALDRRAAAVIGTETPGEVDVSYGGADATPSGKETMGQVMSALNYLIVLMQNADAAPTKIQLLDVQRQHELTMKLLQRWEKIKSGLASIH